jgi:hypothetical protein
MKSNRIPGASAPCGTVVKAGSGGGVCLLALLVALAAPALHAQPATAAPPPWPEDAQPVSAEALHQLLAGRTFQARLANGSGWRLQYQGEYLFVDLTSGARDKGRWQTAEGQVCVTYEGRFPSGCSDMRKGPGGMVYMRRSSTGEIVPLRPE